MFRNVVAALNEALDITMHLKPLTEHFEVGGFFLLAKYFDCLKPDAGRDGLYWRATVIPTDDARDLPGILTQQIFQLCSTDNSFNDSELHPLGVIEMLNDILINDRKFATYLLTWQGPFWILCPFSR